jgi:uncharacterized protein YdeI (YjbR/CyaY-like superfamily)
MSPRFFATAAEFGAWLVEHHASAPELVVGFYKKGSGKPSLTWPESVAEALCVGWIDGVRRSLDEESYQIRFTPRRPGSVWSSVNITLAETLIAAGRMQPAGLAAYAARKENKSGIYSYEQREAELPEPYASRLREHATAWAFFERQAASYKKAVHWWILSAKKEETRAKRLAELIADCEAGQRIPAFNWKKRPEA